jgi:hypothetical protein
MQDLYICLEACSQCAQAVCNGHCAKKGCPYQRKNSSMLNAEFGSDPQIWSPWAAEGLGWPEFPRGRLGFLMDFVFFCNLTPGNLISFLSSGPVRGVQ